MRVHEAGSCWRVNTWLAVAVGKRPSERGIPEKEVRDDRVLTVIPRSNSSFSAQFGAAIMSDKWQPVPCPDR